MPDGEGLVPEGLGGEAGAGAAPAGDGDPPVEDEDARMPAKARDHGAPTRAQWEECQAAHVPFHCLAGRLDSPPHRRVGNQEAPAPEVHFDCAVCRRRREEYRVVARLAIALRQARAARCGAVPQKGALAVAAAEVTAQGINGFDIT